MRATRVRPDFTGTWHIKRRVFGHNARFSGTCTIDAEGHYSEDGVLVQPHYAGPAFQRYIYEQNGDDLRVLFADGRIFLMLHFDGGVARGRHYCGDDIYDAVFKLKQDKWIAAYTVRGPRKDYTAVSIMMR